jgi:hypothetical protein
MVRSCIRSFLLRLSGRKREKTRPNIDPGIGSNDPLPYVLILTTPGLPMFRLRDNDSRNARTSLTDLGHASSSLVASLVVAPVVSPAINKLSLSLANPQPQVSLCTCTTHSPTTPSQVRPALLATAMHD